MRVSVHSVMFVLNGSIRCKVLKSDLSAGEGLARAHSHQGTADKSPFLDSSPLPKPQWHQVSTQLSLTLFCKMLPNMLNIIIACD